MDKNINVTAGAGAGLIENVRAARLQKGDRGGQIRHA